MVILQQALATLVNPSDPAFGRATSLYTREAFGLERAPMLFYQEKFCL